MGEEWRARKIAELTGSKPLFLFDDALRGWYEEYLRNIENKKKKTHKKVPDTYRFFVKDLLNISDSETNIKLFMGKRLSDLTDPSNFKATVMTFVRIKRRKGLVEDSIRRHIAVISSVLSYALLHGMIEHMPPINLIKRSLEKGEPRGRFLGEEEYDRLTDMKNFQPINKHIRNIIIFAVETGLRTEELLSLRWQDIQENRIYLETTKNGKSRNVPISAKADFVLKPLHKQLHKNIAIRGYIFCTKEGKRYGHVKRAFASACKRAGIENLRLHDLRRTFATWRLQGIRGKKLSLLEVSVLLGHSSLDMTKTTYAFVNEKDIEL